MKFRILSIMAVVAVVLTSCYKSDIDNLQAQIDALKGGEIATLESQVSSINTTVGQLQTTQAQLQGYVSELQKDSQTYKTQIAELQSVDQQLSARIDELKSYTDTEIGNAKSWAEGTFATLDQMDSLSTVVAAILVKVGNVESEVDSITRMLTSGYTEAIKKAVADVETSMKKWVNEQLADYYTIAQIDATLDSIGKSHDAKDSAIFVKVIEQKIELDSARVQITRAYKAAVKTACDSLQGVITTKLATDIAAAKTDLQRKIDSINAEITTIKSRLTTVEGQISALLARLQSIVVVPTYSDGSVMILEGANIIKFEVLPADNAKALIEKAQADKDTSLFSFKVVSTQTKGTQAASLKITGFGYNETAGTVEITVDATEFESFFDGSESLSASFTIATADGNVSLSSSYFPLYPFRLKLYNTTTTTQL